jgi:carbamoyl-phosphate synthase large subunit
MVNKNILFTSVGRRNYMVSYFRNAFGGKIYATNSILETSGMFEADCSFQSPPIKSDAYIPFILDLCLRENIHVIIPLFDMDLSVLSKSKSLFKENNIQVIVSDYSIIDLCFDKLRYPSLLETIGIQTPKTYSDLSKVLIDIENEGISFPLILKPRWGTGSIATEIVSDMDSLLTNFKVLTDKLYESYLQQPVPAEHKNQIIIQELVKGQEYGIDVVNDLKGDFFISLSKKKHSMRSGETDVAEIVNHSGMVELAERLGKNIKHIGVLDVDIILTPKNEIYVIDLNPRFGGGYPFSHTAGLNVPLYFYKWLNNESIEKSEIKIEYNKIIAKGISLVVQK